MNSILLMVQKSRSKLVTSYQIMYMLGFDTSQSKDPSRLYATQLNGEPAVKNTSNPIDLGKLQLFTNPIFWPFFGVDFTQTEIGGLVSLRFFWSWNRLPRSIETNHLKDLQTPEFQRLISRKVLKFKLKTRKNQFNDQKIPPKCRVIVSQVRRIFPNVNFQMLGRF